MWKPRIRASTILILSMWERSNTCEDSNGDAVCLVKSVGMEMTPKKEMLLARAVIFDPEDKFECDAVVVQFGGVHGYASPDVVSISQSMFLRSLNQESPIKFQYWFKDANGDCYAAAVVAGRRRYDL